MLRISTNQNTTFIMSDEGDIIRTFTDLSPQRMLEVTEAVEVVNMIYKQTPVVGDLLRKRMMVYNPVCHCMIDDLLITYMVGYIGNPEANGSAQVLVSESLFVMMVKLYQLDHSTEDAVEIVRKIESIRIDTFIQYCKYRIMNYVSVQDKELVTGKTYDQFMLAYLVKLGKTRTDSIDPTSINKYMSLKLKELGKEFLA